MSFTPVHSMMDYGPFDGASAGRAIGGGLRQNKLAKLMGAVDTSKDDAGREKAFQQLGAFDPNQGRLARKEYASEQEELLDKVGKGARYLKSALAAGDMQQAQGAWDAIYDYMAKQAVANGGQPPPRQLTPDFIEQMKPGMEKIIAMTGGMEANKGTEGRVVGNALVDPYSGKVLYQGERQQNRQIIQDAEGNYFSIDPADPNNAMPVRIGGGVSQQQDSGLITEQSLGGGRGILNDAFFAVQEQAESGGNPYAVSPKGAFGPMQIMPATARDPGFGMKPLPPNATPEQNRAFGQEYMRRMAGKYGGNVRAGLAAYNWGPGNFDNMLASTGGDVEAAIARAPKETRDYVAKIAGSPGGSSQTPQGRQLRGASKTPAGGMTEYQREQLEIQRAQLEIQREKMKVAQDAMAQATAARQAAEGLKAKAAGAGEPSKADASAAGLAQDAINFAAAFIGKSPDEVGKMTPEKIREAMKSGGGRTMTGPLLGRVPGVGAVFNSDLEAYSNSASGKQARLNNPSGPVTNADFDVARKSVWSAEKPANVNADLVYQALTWKSRRKPPSEAAPARAAPKSAGGVDDLLSKYGVK